MSDNDIRWLQRFNNFTKALKKLSQAVSFVKSNYFIDNQFNETTLELGNDIIKEGLIQRFEYTHELAWNVMKDYAFFQGNSAVGGSRDATREALRLNLFDNGRIWMEMINSRNRTSHTYNEEVANDIFIKVVEIYYPEFIQFEKIMLLKKEQEEKYNN